jgi:hypothetical protein
MLVDLSVGIAEGMMKIPFLPDVKIDVLRALADGHALEIRSITVDMPVSVRPPDFAYPIHRTLFVAQV